MIKRYRAAMMGQGGIFSALKTAWASRFHSIRAFVMIPSTSEKLELKVHYSQQHEDDIVTLTRSNWRTGESSTLYEGSFTNGTHKKPRHQRD